MKRLILLVFMTVGLGGCFWPPSGTPTTPPTTAESTTTTVADTTTSEAPTTTVPDTTTTAAQPTTTVTLDTTKPKFPDATNTGVPKGTILTPSGGKTITVDGTVIDGLDVNGSLVVAANNVTIRRTRVTSTSPWIIMVRDGFSGTLIEDVEIDGKNATLQAVGIGWNGYTARRINVHNVEDGFRLGNNIEVEDSYIHDLWHGPTSHNDGFQSTGGSNIVLRHNTCLIPNDETACVLLKTDQGPIDNVGVYLNNFNGGTYTVYSVVGKPEFGYPTHVTFDSNRIGTDYVYGPASLDGDAEWIDNYWADTGEIIP